MLEYFGHEPVHRFFHQNQITFGLLYAFNENFVLVLLPRMKWCTESGRLPTRCPATRGNALPTSVPSMGFMYGHPGKKMLFMGGRVRAVA